MEQRQLLTAVVATPDPRIDGSAGQITAPVGPKPGHTFFVDGAGDTGAGSQWNMASAIAPNTTNDLILNHTPTDTNYSACCEAGAGSPGNIAVFTDGTMGAGVSDPSAATNVIADLTLPWHATYSLGTNPGGYDITEIDSITGHQDYRTQQHIDIEVQFAGSTNFVSLSGGNGFSFTQDGHVNTSTNLPDPNLRKGSAQMAIVNSSNPGTGAIVKNVSAIRFDNLPGDPAFFRELVVTGTASSTTVTGTPTAPTGLTAVYDGNTAINLSFTNTANNEQGFLIQRATSASGPFTTIGTIASAANPGDVIPFTDTNIAGNTSYFYQVVAFNSNGQAASNIAGPVVIPAIGAEAHYYNVAFWAGTPAVSTTVLSVNYNSGGGSPDPAIRTSNNSTVFTGKVHTDAAGTYTFISNTDDDGYLYVNGQLVSSDPGGHGTRNATNLVPISLAGNTDYDFVLLESQGGGGAGANMLWVEPGQTAAPVLVPANRLTPVSDAPQIPTAFALNPFSSELSPNPNAHGVDFTFDSNNNAVVKYLLQRRAGASTSDSDWATVNSTDPQGSVLDFNNPSSGLFLDHIADASALPGTAYQYRVVAMNFDHTTPSTSVNVSTPALPAQSPGVEARFFNGELAASPQDPRAIMVNGTPSEFQADQFGITGAGSSLPIDANFGNNSPDFTNYTDIPRIHVDDFATLFTGKIRTDAAGTYTFITNSDDDGFMWVNDVLVSSDPGGHGTENAPNLVPISLAANTEYDFILIQQERGGGAAVHVSWVEPDGMGGSKPVTVIPAFTPADAGGPLGGFEMIMDAPNKQTINATTGAIVTDNTQSAAANVAISSVGPAGIKVTWTDQSFSEVWFEVQRSTDATNWTTIGRSGFDTNTFTDNTTSVPAGTTYSYRVRGMNFDSAGTFSNTGDTAHVHLQAPTIAARNCDAGVVQLNWSDTGESETGYAVYDATTPGGPYTLVTTTAANATEYMVSGLNPAGTYYFVVKAVGNGTNVIDSGNSNEVRSIAVGPVPVQHGTNFGGATDIHTLGNGTLTGPTDTPANALRLTAEGAADQYGGAFTNNLENVQGFDTTFQFQFNPADNTDPVASGFTFQIQNNTPPTIVVGQGGGTLAYSGTPNSVAVKFRISGGRVTTGVYTNGTLGDAPSQNPSTTPAPVNTAIDLTKTSTGGDSGFNWHTNPGDKYQAHLVYDGTTLTETITDLTKNITIVQTYTIDIPTTVGDKCAYVGFSGAGSGGTVAEMDILNWTFASAPPSLTTSQTVAGTSGNDTIVIKKDADGTHDDIWVNVASPSASNMTQQALIGQSIVINGNGGTDTLTLDSTNGNPLPSGAAGTALRLVSGTGKFSIATLPTVDASHVVDVGKSTVEIPYTGTSPLSAVQAALKAGFIKSTDAAASSSKFAIADVDSAGKVTLSYRVVGDINGDGTVGFADLLTLAQNYNGTGRDWSKGDLNYDGAVGFADLLALAQHYNQTAAAAPAVAASSSLAAQTLDSVLLKGKKKKH